MIKSSLFVLLLPLIATAAERQPVNGIFPKVASPAVTHNGGRQIALFDKDSWIGPMWQPNDNWDEIVIDRNVTLTGSILIPRSRKRPLVIRGRDRSTSRLVGTNSHQWLRTENDLARRHSAVFVDTTQTVTISDLTSLNPDKYHFVGYSHTRLVVERTDIIDNRRAYTTDGVGGGKGTIIRDSFIDTYDDSIKFYAADMLIENVTIVHNRNGAPIQFGWGGEQGSGTIRNLTVIANEPQIYNQGVFGRAAQRNPQNQRSLQSSVKVEGFRLVVPAGKKVPPLFMWSTPDGLPVFDFTLTVTGLCSGPKPSYNKREQLTVEPRGQEKAVKLITPDCP